MRNEMKNKSKLTLLPPIRDSAGYQLVVQARDFVTVQPLINASSSTITSQAQLNILDSEWRFAA